MTLEKQVTSLELSKRLRELGAKQESYFMWHRNKLRNLVYLSESFEITKPEECERVASAFTVAELGELLPGTIETENAAYANPEHPNKGMRDGYYVLSCGRSDPKSTVRYFDVDYADKSIPRDVLRLHTEMADTEADARAKMLIYLLENNLITLS